MAALPHGICNLEALLIVRAMRLDRLAPATRAWVEEVLGQRQAEHGAAAMYSTEIEIARRW